ncbi:hypothetical protein DV737_g4313, partial [Chaetothyriales sp. CBS 132003]
MASTPSAHMAITTLSVGGMTCGACTSAVEAAFKGVDGAGAVSVSLMTNRAVVHHDPAKLAPAQLAELIEDRGFDAEVLSTNSPQPTPKLVETTINVTGMTCGACTSAIESGFKDVPGLKSASVSLMTNRAVVQHDPSLLTPEAVAEIIEDRGFDADIKESKPLRHIKPAVTAAEQEKSGLMTTTVSIDGMTCGACTSAIERAFKGVDGVVRFNISLLAGRAVISHDPARLSANSIVSTVDDAGFDAKIVSSSREHAPAASSACSLQLKIFGLVDGQSATALEEQLRSLNGVTSAVVSLSTSRATLTYDSDLIGLRAIVEAVDALGYHALLAETDDNNAQLESLAKTREIREWKQAFFTCLFFAVPVFCITMLIPMFLPFLDFASYQIIPGLFLGDIIAFALTVPVQFGIGKRFYISAFKSLRHRSPTMDVLVIIGTSAAFFFSCFAVLIAVFIPPHNKPGTVFDTSTMLFTFITLGRWLENRAKGQTSKALSNLMSLAPSMATIYEDPLYAEKLADAWDAPSSPVMEKGMSYDGDAQQNSGLAAVEKSIPTELIDVGDIVILRPGDRIPADGTVIRGDSYVDESMVTGEPMPILKKKGSQLIAGTVNGAGKLDFKVTRAGKDTQLSQIVGMVQDAQTSRAPIQRMADLVAGYFVPVIILLGLVTFISWMILSHILPHPPKIFLEAQSGGKFMVCLKLCISVIVFACPCALGLATPTAVMVGTGTASQQGILVKGGAALEIATRITHVVFDKTGTLTFGKLKVADVQRPPPWSQDDRTRLWWTLVCVAESGSEHPIARSVVAHARDELCLSAEDPLPGQLADFRNTVGNGVAAAVVVTSSHRSHAVLIGNSAFLRRKHIKHPEIGPSQRSISTPMSSTGITSIYVAIDGEYAGFLGMSDTLKPTAPAAIAGLHKMGISTSIVTGDTLDTAAIIARSVGIPVDSIRASVSPGQKQEIIAELQAEGEVVAMVGDGVNDSPALATANVGIGLVSGSDIAVEAADIVIMRSDDLLNIPASLDLCRIIFRRIKMNLIWACVYNVVGLPFAMGIFLPFGYHMPPLLSATAMMFSSISVTLSSLALRWVGRPKWLAVEQLESEAASIKVPVRGQPRELSGIEGLQSRIMAFFDAGIAKRREKEHDRGSYVQLRTVGEHLSLAPLAPKYPIEPADYSPYFDPSTAEVHTSASIAHVSALPSPGGILSNSPSSSRATSRSRLKKRARSQAAINLADSGVAAAPSGALTSDGFGHPALRPGHGDRAPTSRSQLRLTGSDWIVQTGLTLAASSRENKGQSWIVQRNSSTSLASLHVTVDEPARERRPRSVRVPSFGSRPGSRPTSRAGSRAGSRSRRSRRDLTMTSVADFATAPLVHHPPEDVRPDWADPESQAEIAARVAAELADEMDDSDPYGMLNFEEQVDIELDSEDEREVRRELMAGQYGWFDGVIDVLLRIEDEYPDPELGDTVNQPRTRRGEGVVVGRAVTGQQGQQGQQAKEEVLADDQVEAPPDHPQSMWDDVKWFGRLLARTVGS